MCVFYQFVQIFYWSCNMFVCKSQTKESTTTCQQNYSLCLFFCLPDTNSPTTCWTVRSPETWGSFHTVSESVCVVDKRQLIMKQMDRVKLTSDRMSTSWKNLSKFDAAQKSEGSINWKTGIFVQNHYSVVIWNGWCVALVTICDSKSGIYFVHFFILFSSVPLCHYVLLAQADAY